MEASSSPDGNYWGNLINTDKSPSPLLEQLCLGLAQTVATLASTTGTSELVPEKLATFYREVGGNYDTLFLHTKGPSLSFIYQSLGCFHTLQPTTNAFEPPSIPALLPGGFVRWHTIQLLLCPDEHSQYLQHAVGKWDIPNPTGGIFPKTIPRDAFPSTPDPEMVGWHERVSQQLKRDYQHVRSPADSVRGHGARMAEADYFHRQSRRPAPSSSRTESQEDVRRSRQRSSTDDRPSISGWWHRSEGSSRFNDPRGSHSKRRDSNSSRSPSSPPTEPPRRAKSMRVGMEEAEASGRTAIPKKRVPKFTIGSVSSDSDSLGDKSPFSARPSSIEETRSGRSQHLSPARKPIPRRHSHDNVDPKHRDYRQARESYSPNTKREREAAGSPAAASGSHRRYDDVGSSRFSPLSGSHLPGHVLDDPERGSSPGTPPLVPRVHARQRNSDLLGSVDEYRRRSFHGCYPSVARRNGSSDSDRPTSTGYSRTHARADRRWTSPDSQTRRAYA